MTERELSATDAVRDHFSQDADYWQAIYESSDDVAGHVYHARLERALRLIDASGIAAPAQVIDVGAGAGPASVALAARGFRVLAVDSTQRMLDLTREHARASEVEVEVKWGDATALPVETQTQDLVVALGLLPWIEDSAPVLKEFRRVLKPGGRLVVSADNQWRLNELLDPSLSAVIAPVRRRAQPVLAALRRRERANFEVRRHSPDELVRLVEAQGFTVTACSTVGFGPFTFRRRGVINGARGRALSDWLERRAQTSHLLAQLGVHIVLMASLLPAERPR